MLSVFFTSLCVLQAPVVTAPVATVEFAITHDGAVGESLDGRVYVMLTQGRVPPR